MSNIFRLRISLLCGDTETTPCLVIYFVTFYFYSIEDMNIRKLFALLAGVSMVANVVLPGLANAATPDTELWRAYEWAYSKGVTTMPTYEAANMYNSITRAEMAKMLSVYATEILGKTADTSRACTFTDVDSVKWNLHDFIIESCQLGIMGQNMPNNAFRPYDTISRAEFGTALSRLLWGDEHNGGTPYYADHLNALKEAGIMTQIANAESTKEIRGYVMLMLMRSEANSICEDVVVKVTCAAEAVDGTYKDCPTVCRDNGDDSSDTTVKSGDLAIKVTPATDRKALIEGKVSDLDTITLKASEKITVNSITLERFGYSTASDVDTVWLEDAYGNKITDEKSLSSSKDTVTLKIKKEYRDMEESNALTIVLKTSATAKAGGTIGFKVTDVDASAKNLDLSDYNPYTYELVKYDGAEVTVSVKGNDKNYNYEAGEYYEVSRLKVKAGASVLALNGITLTNKGGKTTYVVEKETTDPCPTANAGYGAGVESTDKKSCTYTSTNSLPNLLDLDEFVSKVKVTADGKEVSGLKYSVTKDNEIVLSWNTIEVAINKDVQLVVSVAMEGLDEYGKIVRLVLDETGDLNAVEKKTGARVTVKAPAASNNSWKVYTFNGSKIKFTNTKLASTIDAAQGSEDVVIAKGNVTVGEEVKISKLVLDVTPANVIEDMTLTIAGESYDATVTDSKTKFTFNNVIIEKAGELELSVDVVDEDTVVGKTATITYNGVSSIGKAIFANDNGRYEDSREYVSQDDVSGSITISKLKAQESKATLKNNLSKTVEYPKGEANRNVVFDGTYTAKKSNITLNEFAIVGDDSQLPTDTTATFYIYVDGEEVGSVDESDIKAVVANFDAYEDFADVEVEAGKSVSVKVEAEIAPEGTANNVKFDLYLRGDDKNWTEAGFAKASLTNMNFVLNGSVNVSDSTTMARKTVVMQENEITMAKFVLEPSKSDSVRLDNLVFEFRAGANTDNITVEVDGTELDIVEPTNYWNNLWVNVTSNPGKKYVKYDGENLDIDWEVEVVVKARGLSAVAAGDIDADDATNLTLASVNGVAKGNVYSRLILPALVTFDTMESDGAVTTFDLIVDDFDGEQVEDLKVFTNRSTTTPAWEVIWLVGSELEATNGTNVEIVNKVTFKITKGSSTWNVTLLNTAFPDYFKTTAGKTLRVYNTD